MKNTTKALSLLLTVCLIFAALPICLPTVASAATLQKASTVIDFESSGGWSDSNKSTFLSVISEPNNSSNRIMEMTSSENKGYNMEIASGSNSTVAYQLKPSTSYTISFDYKPAGEYTDNDRIGIYLGALANYASDKPKLPKEEIKFSNSANPGSWNTLTVTFTTSANQYYNEYKSGSTNTHVCDKLYIVYSAGISSSTTQYNAYIDNIVITNNDIKTQEKYTTYNFNTNKGISNLGNAGSYTTDPGNSNEKVLKIESKKHAGASVELAANGNNSSDPFKTLANTSYTVSFDYKLAEGTHLNTEIYLYLGKQYAYDSKEGKYQIHKIDLENDPSYTEWRTFTCDFKTTANMYYSEYFKNGSSTSVYDKIYITLSSGDLNDSATGGAIYIDNITITNNDYPEKYTTYNFNNKTGLSNMANDTNAGSVATYVTDPKDSSNVCVKSSSKSFKGTSIELAESGDKTSGAFSLQRGTSYTVTFRYRIDENSHLKKRLSLYIGSKFAWDSKISKKALFSIDINEAVDYDKWFTFTHTFTMTDNLYYQTGNDGTQYTFDKLYITISIGEGSEGGSMYIDDVVIINNDIEGSEPDTASSYEIKNFTHTPYLENGYGVDANDWRVSGRMFSTTDGENSVLKYQYSLHPEHITEGFTNSGTGTRGNFMGTNGYAISATNLVTKDGKSVTIQQDSAYKISFKYKVTSVETGSYIGFAVVRGSYTKSWTESHSVGTIGQLVFRAEHAKTDEWKEVEFTFLANYASSIDKNNLKLGMVGYGECLIDDIVVEAIPEEDVEPLPDTSDYSFTTSGGKATINEYKGTATELSIPTFFNGAMLDEIADGGFLFSDTIKTITVPGGVTKIGSYAFEKNYSLETIELPSTISSIGDRAFYDTPALKSINVHNENTNYVSVDGVLYNKDKTVLIAYPAAKTNTEFTVPNTVTEIAEAAFQGAKNLKTINLPSNLTKIGNNAFRGCLALETINLPASLTKIGASAFRDCKSLENVNLNDSIDFGKNAFNGCSALYTFGNLDTNSEINASDALKLAKVLAGRADATLSFSEELAADLNHDGNIDLLDSAILQRHLAEWSGYEELPCTGRKTDTYNTYNPTGENAELVINLTNSTGDYIVSNRDFEYDESKEDLIIILAIGQSNQGTNVGYASEQSMLTQLEALGLPAPEAPTRPEPGTVYSTSSAITKLTTDHDAYTLCDTSRKGSTYGGSTPALGKTLYEATGAKVLFIQSAMGATGMHEWVKDPENYTCSCSENGKGNLYSNAIKKYLKTYYALKDQYNIISTGYYWNQGEHEEVYARSGNTVHDVQSYYDAYKSMHTTLMADCEFDFGSIFMPRSVYQYNPKYQAASKPSGMPKELTLEKLTQLEAVIKEHDTIENSRRTTVARQAMYRIVNDIPEVFVASDYAEKIIYGDDDIVNRIHYSQKTYNIVGKEAAETILKKLDIAPTPEFTGITVYNSQGIILATFDKDGKLTSGSKTVDITNADNRKLHVAIQPLGTYYSYNISYGNVSDFSTDFFEINANTLTSNGYTSFDIVINPPVK